MNTFMNINEDLVNAYMRQCKLNSEFKSENKRLLEQIKNLKKVLENHIVLVKKNTFNFKTWECEYVDRYFFNSVEKKIEVKYDHELEEPENAYERVCMEEAGILKKIDDTEEFYKKMRKTKKEGVKGEC